MTDQNATPQFDGSYTALITPFADGKVDETAFRKLVNWQIESGTNGLVPVGTTGESPTLSHAEHDRVIEICIEQTAGRIPVIAGAGSNRPLRLCDLPNTPPMQAQTPLIVSPYYNKPTQRSLLPFYRVAKAVEVPIIVYDIRRSIVV